MSGLSFYTDLRSDEEIDLEAATEQGFVNPAGNTFPIAAPAMKAAAMTLSAAYPGALDYPALLSAAALLQPMLPKSDRLLGTKAGGQSYAVFREALFQLVMAHGVMPTVWAGLVAAEPSPSGTSAM